MSEQSRGEVITFYSYKGGVGRSMALANVATLLAHLGKRVLAIDFDLEAPGLHRYFGIGASDPPSDPKRGGVIELFYALQSQLDALGPRSSGGDRAKASEDAEEERYDRKARAAIARLIERGKYLREISVCNPNDGSRSPLSLVVSGCFDATYPERVRNFPWQPFYEAHPYFVELLVDELGQRFDYVLIDSRTGTTDVGNICTVLFPEKLVLVSTPNEQSLNGATEVGRQAVELRKTSTDLRPLPIFPLMSRIENAEYTLQRTWIDEARRRFEEVFRVAYGVTRGLSVYFDAIQIPHRSFYAYGEVIAAERERLTESRSLVAAYREFVDALQCNNALDAQTAMTARFIMPSEAQQRATVAEEQTTVLREGLAASERREHDLNEDMRRLKEDPEPPTAATSNRARSGKDVGRAIGIGLAVVSFAGLVLALVASRDSPAPAAVSDPSDRLHSSYPLPVASEIASTASTEPAPIRYGLPAPGISSKPEPATRRQPTQPTPDRKPAAGSPLSKPPPVPPTADQAILAGIQPRASSTEMDSARTKSGRQVYRFDVWIETTADAAGAIKSVDYFFDHPSFETRHFPSEQPPKFLRFYEGWGCLEHVLLTVKFKDGTSGNLDFNQCNAL